MVDISRNFFLHSPVIGHLGDSQNLAIASQAVINLGVHTYFCITIFLLFGYMPRHGISGSFVRLVIF